MEIVDHLKLILILTLIFIFIDGMAVVLLIHLKRWGVVVLMTCLVFVVGVGLFDLVMAALKTKG
jgi:hypothetical protein